MIDCRRPSYYDRLGSCKVVYNFMCDNGKSLEFSEYTPSKNDAVHRASDLRLNEQVFTVKVFEMIPATSSFLIAEMKGDKINLIDPDPCVREYPCDQKQETCNNADSFQVICSYAKEKYSKDNSNDWYPRAADAFARLEEHRKNPDTNMAKIYVHYRFTRDKLICVNDSEGLVFTKDKK